LLGGEELAGLFEEHAQLVVTVRAEKVEEVLFEDLLASHPPGDLESAESRRRLRSQRDA
jgi:hypothetical protein